MSASDFQVIPVIIGNRLDHFLVNALTGPVGRRAAGEAVKIGPPPMTSPRISMSGGNGAGFQLDEDAAGSDTDCHHAASSFLSFHDQEVNDG